MKFILALALALNLASSQTIDIPEQSLNSLQKLKGCAQNRCKIEAKNCMNKEECLPILSDCSAQCLSDQNCWFKCLSEKKFLPATRFGFCVRANGCFKKPQEQISLEQVNGCTKVKCQAQYAACQEDKKCQPLMEYLLKQCQTSLNCWIQFLGVIPEKSEAVLDLAYCAQKQKCVQVNQGGVPTDRSIITCASQQCAPQIQNCLADKQCIGNLSKCYQKCQKEKYCWAQCIYQSRNKNSDLVSSCAFQSGCLVEKRSNLQECSRTQCAKQWKVCDANPKCLDALQQCQAQCKTDVNCWTSCLLLKEKDAMLVGFCSQAKKCI